MYSSTKTRLTRCKSFSTKHQRTPCSIPLFIMYLWCFATCIVMASDNPMTLNGGSLMAMAGESCVALAVDKRFASGMQMVTISPRRVYIPHRRIIVGFAGLDGDVRRLSQELSVHVSAKQSREEQSLFGIVTSTNQAQNNRQHEAEEKDKERKGRPISPRALASLTSHILYAQRGSPYFCEPIIVGLEEVPTKLQNPTNNQKQNRTHRPFLCTMDMIGSPITSRDFACVGAAATSMYGTAQALWKPHMSQEELVQVCGRAFLSALERDCLSGYGAKLYVISEEGGMVVHELKCRND